MPLCVAFYLISVKINTRVVETYTSLLLARICPPIAEANAWSWPFMVMVKDTHFHGYVSLVISLKSDNEFIQNIIY